MELQHQFEHITQLIAKARSRAFQAVNRELVTLYWSIGEYVSQKVSENAWGKSVVQDLACYIQSREPNVKGFSAQNIWRMKQFYETYKDHEKLAPLVRELSWTHHGLGALDRDIRKPHENPSIGILLCKGKDDTVVEYAMSRNLSPALIADYQTKLPDKALLKARWDAIIDQLSPEEDEEL